MELHHGSVAEYRASEGRSVNVPYRGPIKNTVIDILGGVRSTCTYVGAERLKNFPSVQLLYGLPSKSMKFFVPYQANTEK